jgi:tetratricopeptide (TPR) repeat protein
MTRIGTPGDGDGDDATPVSRPRPARLSIAGRRADAHVRANEAPFAGTVISSRNGSVTVQVCDGPYRLAPFGRRRRPLGDSTGPLLAADSAVVPFWGRRAELKDLRQWRDRAVGSFAVRLLHAPAGQGKTRLARRFAELSAAEGWQVLRATRDRDGPPSPVGGARLRTLIVVDDGDRWPWTDLIRLIQDPALTAGETRVLLLARTDRWWRSFVHELHGTLVVPADAVELPAAAGDVADLQLLYRHGWTSFARIRQVTGTPAVPAFPRPVGDTTVLDVFLAALTDVQGRLEATDRPAGPATLLDQERARWARAQAANPETTGPQVMGRTVLIAALLGRLPRRAAPAVLRSAGLAATDAGAEQIIDDHARLYPPAVDGYVLEPPAPDRLAEDLLGSTVPDGPGPSPESDPWAADVLARAVAAADQPGLPRDHLRHALLVFIGTAVRRPHLARRQLLPLLRDDPGLALRGGGPAVAALLDLPDLDAAVLQAILGQLPAERSTDHVAAAAELARRLAEMLLPRENDPHRRADIHHQLGLRLLHAHRYDAARTELQQEAGLRRKFADAQFADAQFADAQFTDDRFTDDRRTAEALALLAEAYAGRRDYARALDVAGEARQLFGSGPAPDGARTTTAARTSELTARLQAQTGRPEQAVEDQDAAVAMWRTLSLANALHLPSLAQAQDVLALYLHRAGHADEAVRTAGTAIRIWRRLAEMVPTLYEPRLALSLDGSLRSSDRNNRRLTATLAETIGRFRPLMRDHAYFQVRFCRSAVRWARLMPRVDHRLDLLREAAGRADRLARVNPGHYRPDKAELLFAFAQNAWWTTVRLNEAQLAADEAGTLFDLLAEADPRYRDRAAACRRLRADIVADR